MKTSFLYISMSILSIVGYGQAGKPGNGKYANDETYRPAYHFSAPAGWINDPNGLVYQNGEYHLYYQHNPDSTVWGPMHWGHAVSRDLVTWKHLPIALEPDALGTIFSGSAIIDEHNTADFGRDALIAVYTSAGGVQQAQSVAASLDGGRTFTKYTGNPVLPYNTNYRDFRDPKVFWHDATSKWIMALATGGTISLYGSPDLKEWEKLSEFGEGVGAHYGVWECPDLFPLEWNGGTKWVLLVSLGSIPNVGTATQYFIGDFDGTTFCADNLPYPLWIDYGRDNYAGVTWNNTPDGRRLFIGWMSNWYYANNVPSVKFRGAMTLVRELSLAHNGKHLVVRSYPVAESETLKKKSRKFKNIDCNGRHTIESLCPGNRGVYVVEMTIIPESARKFGFTLLNGKGEKLVYTFNLQNKKLEIDRPSSGFVDFHDYFASPVISAPLAEKDAYRISLYIDKASSELFVNGGEVVSTNIVFPTAPYDTMEFTSDSLIRIEDMVVSRIAQTK